MWQEKDFSGASTADIWEHINEDLKHLISPDEPVVSTLANAAALLYHSLPEVNWAGFYLFEQGKLWLGPFGGKPACTVIELGKGVCGKAAKERQTIIVDDVLNFPGHITCDTASRSEIVVPILVEGNLFGILDIDSPTVGRFTAEDKAGAEAVAITIVTRGVLNALYVPDSTWAVDGAFGASSEE